MFSLTTPILIDNYIKTVFLCIVNNPCQWQQYIFITENNLKITIISFLKWQKVSAYFHIQTCSGIDELYGCPKNVSKNFSNICYMYDSFICEYFRKKNLIKKQICFPRSTKYGDSWVCICIPHLSVYDYDTHCSVTIICYIPNHSSSHHFGSSHSTTWLWYTLKNLT